MNHPHRPQQTYRSSDQDHAPHWPLANESSSLEGAYVKDAMPLTEESTGGGTELRSDLPLMSCTDLWGMMINENNRRRRGVRWRKNSIILIATIKALLKMPGRTWKGPIYESFNWITGTMFPPTCDCAFFFPAETNQNNSRTGLSRSYRCC